MKNVPISFLSALSDDAHPMLAKHDIGTLFGDTVFSTISVCHWCLVTVIFSKCWWINLSQSVLTASIVIRTGVANLLINNCVKKQLWETSKISLRKKCSEVLSVQLHSWIWLPCRLEKKSGYFPIVLHWGPICTRCISTRVLISYRKCELSYRQVWRHRIADSSYIGTISDYFCSKSSRLLLFRLLTSAQCC